MRKPIFLIAVVLVLAGCEDEPPPEEPMTQYEAPPARPTRPPPPPAEEVAQQIPAPVAASKPRLEEVKPLAKGLLAAAEVGSYMDDQEKELRARLRSSGVTISRTGDNLVLNVPSDSLFSGRSMALSDRGEEIIHAVAMNVRRFDSTSLAVNGFTDTTGTADQNMKVSQQRADAIDKALVTEGVDAHRVAAQGFGSDFLKVPTGPNVNESRNRRIEIKIAPRVKA